jgi:hypothetical protein
MGHELTSQVFAQDVRSNPMSGHAEITNRLPARVAADAT